MHGTTGHRAMRVDMGHLCSYMIGPRKGRFRTTARSRQLHHAAVALHMALPRTPHHAHARTRSFGYPADPQAAPGCLGYRYSLES
jgi:hypothetical protein